MGINKYNRERYYDPTPYEALTAIEQEAKKRRYPRTYICSPFRGDVERNVQKAIEYCRFALDRGRFPIAPHIWLPRFMDDADPAERDIALSFGLRLLGGCREVWAFGSGVSEGMRREIAEAERRGIPVRYFNEDKEEIHRGG